MNVLPRARGAGPRLRGIAAWVAAAVHAVAAATHAVAASAPAIAASALAVVAPAHAVERALGGAAPRVIDDRGRAVDLPRVPQRIVALAPALTETVCALGACGRLVGTDRHSNWPASVRALPKLGGLDDVQVERIVALRPDLVLAATSTRAVERLEALGLRVLALEPRTLAQIRRTLDAVATALGDEAAAAAVWQRLEQRIDAAAARVPLALRGRRVYFEVASVPYAAGEASFVGELLARLGLRNIAGAALGPFPQLNPEFVLRALPEVAMGSAQAVAEMPSRPGWSALPALRARSVCGFGAAAYDTLMRAGPRLGDAAEAIADCLAALPVAPR